MSQFERNGGKQWRVFKMLLKFYWYHFGCCVANTMSESRGPSRETNQEAIEIIQFGVGPVAVRKAKSGQDLDNLKEIIILKKLPIFWPKSNLIT